MPQHISRKDLKKDEIRETFAHGAEAVRSHQQMFFLLVAAAVLAGGAVLGWWLYAERQTAKASAAFDDAMKIFQAHVLTPGETSQPGEVTYADAKNKYQDASQRFMAVAAQYRRSRPGQLADYYTALSLEHLDRNDEARSRLQELAARADRDYADLARFELAQLDDRTGRASDAVQIYNDLLTRPSVLVPEPTVLFALGEHYRQSNPSEAAKLFKQIKSEYQDSLIAQQADQQLALLPSQP